MKQILAIVIMMGLIVGLLVVLVAEIYVLFHIVGWMEQLNDWIERLGK